MLINKTRAVEALEQQILASSNRVNELPARIHQRSRTVME